MEHCANVNWIAVNAELDSNGRCEEIQTKPHGAHSTQTKGKGNGTAEEWRRPGGDSGVGGPVAVAVTLAAVVAETVGCT